MALRHAMCFRQDFVECLGAREQTGVTSRVRSNMPTRHHVVITGTGRAGTTFLVELLTHLGLDTGYRVEDLSSRKHRLSHAGLENDIRRGTCPHIVKSPWFCDHAGEVLSRKDIVIEHVFVPIRHLHAAAESRRHVARQDVAMGGLWHTTSSEPGVQEKVLLNQLYKLMLALSEHHVPVTLMRYPRIISDSSYLYGKLKPILTGVSLSSFTAAFRATARPELVHRFHEEDR